MAPGALCVDMEHPTSLELSHLEKGSPLLFLSWPLSLENEVPPVGEWLLAAPPACHWGSKRIRQKHLVLHYRERKKENSPMQNSVSRSIGKTLWAEYPIWGGWQGGLGSGCLRCHICSQVTMAHRSASTPRGAAPHPHSAPPALRRTVDLQEKNQPLVVLSCHRPGGPQRTRGVQPGTELSRWPWARCPPPCRAGT